MPQLLQLETNLSAELVREIKNEEQWRLKSRSLYLKSGDINTKYFHNQS